MHSVDWLLLLFMAYGAVLTLQGTRIGRRIRQYQARVEQDLCLNCGYDLRAAANRCPECGASIPQGIAARSQSSPGDLTYLHWQEPMMLRIRAMQRDYVAFVLGAMLRWRATFTAIFAALACIRWIRGRHPHILFVLPGGIMFSFIRLLMEVIARDVRIAGCSVSAKYAGISSTSLPLGEGVSVKLSRVSETVTRIEIVSETRRRRGLVIGTTRAPEELMERFSSCCAVSRL